MILLSQHGPLKIIILFTCIGVDLLIADGLESNTSHRVIREIDLENPVNPLTVQGGCELPFEPLNGKYKIYHCSTGRIINDLKGLNNIEACLEFSCNEGFILDEFREKYILKCQNQSWTSSIPVCIECGKYYRNTLLIHNAHAGAEFPEPWHAVVYYYNQTTTKYDYKCGATIVHSRAVVSAAHCFKYFDKLIDPFKMLERIDQKLMRIGVGKKLRRFELQEELQQILEVEDVRVNNYAFDHRNDIAVIILKDKINIGQNIMPACIDRAAYDNYRYKPQPNTRGKVVGFGTTEALDLSEKLLIAYFNICCDHEPCRLKMKSIFDKKYVTEDKFCVSISDHNGTYLGEGDSGGGFIIRRHKIHYLYGIVSLRTGQLEMLLFTNVPYHIEWLLKNLEPTIKSPTDNKESSHIDCEDSVNNYLCQNALNVTSTDKTFLSTTSKPESSNGCLMPGKPEYGDFDVLDCKPVDTRAKCRKVPGTIVPQFTLLKYTCNEGHPLTGLSSTAFCDVDNKWNPRLPDCGKQCPPLSFDESQESSCFYLNNQVNCNTSLNPGSTVSVQCKPTYHFDPPQNRSLRWTKCLDNGIWVESSFSCKPDCGKKYLSDIEAPWNAAIYKEKGRRYLCLGTIINEKTVVTAAHCLFDHEKKKPFDVNDMRVAVGKSRWDWDYHDGREQRFTVLELNLQREFLGAVTHFRNDIGIIVINGTILMSPAVMPVCLDKPKHNFNGTDEGTIAVWSSPTADEGGPMLQDTLRVIRLSYNELQSCWNSVSEEELKILTHDKFCVLLPANVRVRRGDSGAALTFQIITEDGEVNVLHGIVSTEYKKNHVSAFTNVTIYRDWLQSKLVHNSNR